MELPWSSATEDRLDLPQAKLDLDRDHYSLENVKKRVLEFLAVRKLKNSLKGEWSGWYTDIIICRALVQPRLVCTIGLCLTFDFPYALAVLEG